MVKVGSLTFRMCTFKHIYTIFTQSESQLAYSRRNSGAMVTSRVCFCVSNVARLVWIYGLGATPRALLGSFKNKHTK